MNGKAVSTEGGVREIKEQLRFKRQLVLFLSMVVLCLFVAIAVLLPEGRALIGVVAAAGCMGYRFFGAR